MIVQITPVLIYVYIFEDECAPFINDGAAIFENQYGKTMEVTGNLIAIDLKSVEEVEATLEDFGLFESGLPILQFYVTQRKEED